MTDRMIRLRVARVEATHLAGLVEEFTELIDEDDVTDPALARLTPNAYPDDESASAEFASTTRGDLLGRRATDSALVQRALNPAASLGVDEDGLDHIEIDIPASDVDAWLRTLTALRVVIATRLGIVDEDEHDGEDPRFGVYDWLGFRLDSLVALADALDEYEDDVRGDDEAHGAEGQDAER